VHNIALFETLESNKPKGLLRPDSESIKKGNEGSLNMLFSTQKKDISAAGRSGGPLWGGLKKRGFEREGKKLITPFPRA